MKKIKDMIWPCRITGQTHHPNGRRRKIDRIIEGHNYSSPERAVRAYMNTRPDVHIWRGVEITIKTPTGQKETVII